MRTNTPQRFRLGNYVLFEVVRRTGLGTEYRAGRIDQTGLERFASVLCLDESLTAQREYAERLASGLRWAGDLVHPNIMRSHGFIRVGEQYHLIGEYVWGKDLGAVFDRRLDVPLALPPGLAVAIASGVVAALDHAASTPSATQAFHHGLLLPRHVTVSYEGEVKVGGFGLSRMGSPVLGVLDSAERKFLPPGGLAGAVGDIFALGSLLYCLLTGEAAAGKPEGVPEALARARLLGSGQELPLGLHDFLLRALGGDGGRGFEQMADARRALDDLLALSELRTTLSLATYMFSLFKDDIEREDAMLREEQAFSGLHDLAGIGAIKPRAGGPPECDVRAEELATATPATGGLASPGRVVRRKTGWWRVSRNLAVFLALALPAGAGWYALSRSSAVSQPVPARMRALSSESVETILTRVGALDRRLAALRVADAEAQKVALQSSRPAPAPPTRVPAPKQGRQVAPAVAAAVETPPAKGDLVDLDDPEVSPPVLRAMPALPASRELVAEIEKAPIQVSILVDEEGRVVDTNLISPEPHSAEVKRLAIDHVKEWSYQPANREGVPVKVWVPVTLAALSPNLRER